MAKAWSVGNEGMVGVTQSSQLYVCHRHRTVEQRFCSFLSRTFAQTSVSDPGEDGHAARGAARIDYRGRVAPANRRRHSILPRTNHTARSQIAGESGMCVRQNYPARAWVGVRLGATRRERGRQADDASACGQFARSIRDCRNAVRETPVVERTGYTEDGRVGETRGLVMRAPTTLTFRHVLRSSALEAHARALASRLQRVDECITQCDVTLESLAGSGSVDAPFVVKIDLAVPGAQIHADSLHPDGTGHSGLHSAMRASYENARRQLQDWHRERADRSYTF
jgi:hypothetical protein